MTLDNILKGTIWQIYLILHAEFHSVVKIYDYLNIFKSCQNSTYATEVITDKQTDMITSE